MEKFKAKYSPKRTISTFTESELEGIKSDLPPQVVEFLNAEGRCTYGNDFFWTVLPGEFHDILSEWGLKGKKCFVFMRTSMGSLIYFMKGEFYSFNPAVGTKTELNDLFKLVMNNYLISTSILEGDFLYNLHVVHAKNLPQLNEDEMYALDPTIPEGGSPETSKVVVVKLKEHLHKLAEQYDHKLEK